MVDGYLAHMNKGGAKQKHKYISREWKNGRWVYSYNSGNNKLTQLRKDEINSRIDRSRTSNSFYEKRYRDDLIRAESELDTIPDAVENVKSWYRSGLANRKQFKKDDYDGWYSGSGSKTKYKTYDVNRKSYAKNKYSKTISGKMDSFMEKNGKKIASSLNKTSSNKQKAISFIKSKLNRG